ncbi:hypothetical protein LTT66_25700 [Nocardia gipuzkoensis]|uniref:hypothetical protein n=1 Tax=Nocardia gipuzkoensis TaxID=2749991 RepID=UPI001E34C3DC|nr:hypothetical protein [Nocardia gipuzkoensis]UGT66636.1 hypothetical protein LTT66_25700 [Nocardia gipuzkoensis]
MSARHRTYLVRLDPHLHHESATRQGVRGAFFDWLQTADAEVVELCGADRVVISSAPDVADRIRDLAYVLAVEPHE